MKIVRKSAGRSLRPRLIGTSSLVMVMLFSGCPKESTKKGFPSKTGSSSGGESLTESRKAKSPRKDKGPRGPRGSNGAVLHRKPNGVKASPTKIRVLNDTKKSLTFERTFGFQQALGAMRLDGPMNSSVGLWKCRCKCGMSSCPEAARPRTSLLTMQPGKSFTFEWDGRLRRKDKHPKTGPCCTEFNPPAGRYVFTACTKAGICSHTEVKLPTNLPILIKMSDKSKANDCKMLNKKLVARGAKGFLRHLARHLKTRPLSSCPKTPECLAPTSLKKRLAALTKKKCSLFVVPRGAEVELRAIIPLLPNKLGGEDYSSFSDPHFTRVFRVRYGR